MEISGLIASYLNLAVNCENLGNITKAVKFANEGYHFSLMDLGPRHMTSLNLKAFLDRLAIKLENGSRRLNRTQERGFYRQDQDEYTRSRTVDNNQGGPYNLYLSNNVKHEVAVMNETANLAKGNKFRNMRTKDVRSLRNQPIMVDISDGQRYHPPPKSNLSLLIEELR